MDDIGNNDDDVGGVVPYGRDEHDPSHGDVDDEEGCVELVTEGLEDRDGQDGKGDARDHGGEVRQRKPVLVDERPPSPPFLHMPGVGILVAPEDMEWILGDGALGPRVGPEQVHQLLHQGYTSSPLRLTPEMARNAAKGIVVVF